MRFTFCKSLSVLACLALCSCGGGGGGGGSLVGGSSGTGTNQNVWTAGVFKPSATFAAQCAAPRSGTDPATGKAYPDVRGSTVTENNWLRSWTNELYLWYSEVTDVDPSLYSTSDYFNKLMTTQNDSAGEPKDKFHFTYATSTWETLSSTDVQPGYGVQWVLISTTPPRQLVVAYTAANSSAASANLTRGAEVLTIDAVDLVNANDQASIDTLNAGIAPKTLGESHTFTVRDLGSSTSRSITLTGSTIDPSMLWPRSVMAMGFMLLFAALLMVRMRSMLYERRARALRLQG